MIKHKDPKDATKTWRHVHPSGSPCGRRYLLRSLGPTELPDLTPPAPVTRTRNYMPRSTVTAVCTPQGRDLDSTHMIPPSLLQSSTLCNTLTTSTPYTTTVSTPRMEPQKSDINMPDAIAVTMCSTLLTSTPSTTTVSTPQTGPTVTPTRRTYTPNKTVRQKITQSVSTPQVIIPENHQDEAMIQDML